jgi:hypothetical protein
MSHSNYEKARAALDAWSLDPVLTDDARRLLRAMLADENFVYPLTVAPRASSADELINRLEDRHEEMQILLGLFKFDHAVFPELAQTLAPLAASLTRVVHGLFEKSRLLAANPQAAETAEKIEALEKAFDAIDEQLAAGFAVVARTIAQAPRVKRGVLALVRNEADHQSTET